LVELSLEQDFLKYLEFEGFLQELATSGLKYLEAIADVRSKGIIGPPLYFRPELNLLNLRRVSGKKYIFCYTTKYGCMLYIQFLFLKFQF
jgi:hypothetical protein